MERVVLCRFGEIALKGQNRPAFVRRQVQQVENALADLAYARVERQPGRIFVEGQQQGLDRKRQLAVIDRLQRVFGLVSVSPAVRAPLDLEVICQAAVELAQAYQQRQGSRPVTFKIEARRANKQFEHQSPEINRVAGARVLEELENFSVDVHQPDLVIQVEVRQDYAYVMAGEYPCPGGLPVGVSGKAVVLLSGGIDSPVASWLAMKRGMEILPLHFHSFPYTSERSKQKVIDICRVLARFASPLTLRVVNFTPVQEAIGKYCPAPFTTIIMRRMMARIAQRISLETGGLALVTGESAGQVASQTLQSMGRTSEVVDQLILRPLVCLDKTEIIDRARQIGTYDISIRPYEDCCTVFVPQHPKTKPGTDETLAAEADLPVQELVEAAASDVELLRVDRRGVEQVEHRG